MSEIRLPKQLSLFAGHRVLVWFSCGAASACAAKLAVEQYGALTEVLYCDTLKYEHPDNVRFLQDVARWLGVGIRILHSERYTDIFDVFDKTGWLVGPGGARCTRELKRNVREQYQSPGDIHVFGFGIDEPHRVARFERDNPELYLWWPLVEAGMDKQACLAMLEKAHIDLPRMYKMGYKNNNCIGCVKGKAGYWNKIRQDFPAAFLKMSAQERKMNVSVLRECYLDELQPDVGRYESDYEIECGPVCSVE